MSLQPDFRPGERAYFTGRMALAIQRLYVDAVIGQ